MGQAKRPLRGERRAGSGVREQGTGRGRWASNQGGPAERNAAPAGPKSAGGGGGNEGTGRGSGKRCPESRSHHWGLPRRPPHPHARRASPGGASPRVEVLEEAPQVHGGELRRGGLLLPPPPAPRSLRVTAGSWCRREPRNPRRRPEKPELPPPTRPSGLPYDGGACALAPPRRPGKRGEPRATPPSWLAALRATALGSPRGGRPADGGGRGVWERRGSWGDGGETKREADWAQACGKGAHHPRIPRGDLHRHLSP